MKVEDHGDHQHNFKSVNETILGVVVNDIGKQYMSEALGWDSDKFALLCSTMEKFYHLQEAAEALDEDLPESTKVSGLVEFLKSNAFKKLAFKITTPNDYFVLGWAFCNVLQKLDRGHNHGIMGQFDLRELLEDLKKRRK